MSDKDRKRDVGRRDFLSLLAISMGCVSLGSCLWPLVDQMNPDAGALALSSIEVDLSELEPGEVMTVKWRGKPVFIRHRTQEEIAREQAVFLSDLKDPASDVERTKLGHENILVVVGVCTHLGCIPLHNRGEYGGWFCPCHGSAYDVSGRVRSGPASYNMKVPYYTFTSPNKIKIG